MSQFLNYWVDVFKRKGPHATKNINLRLMHGINRISILMFLMALIVLIIKWIK